MALETELKKLTAAVIELTATFNAARSPRTEAAPKKTSAPAITPEAPKPAKSVSTPEPTPSVADAFGAAAGNAAVVAEPPPAITAEESVVPTKKEMVEKFIEMAQNQPREVAITLLAKYKIAKLPELTDKSQWAAFTADCIALLAAAEAVAK